LWLIVSRVIAGTHREDSNGEQSKIASSSSRCWRRENGIELKKIVYNIETITTGFVLQSLRRCGNGGLMLF
jgi:hypothetical protein